MFHHQSVRIQSPNKEHTHGSGGDDLCAKLVANIETCPSPLDDNSIQNILVPCLGSPFMQVSMHAAYRLQGSPPHVQAKLQCICSPTINSLTANLPAFMLTRVKALLNDATCKKQARS